MGVGSFDMKFVSIDPFDESVLRQLVLHASKHCKLNGADQVKANVLFCFFQKKGKRSSSLCLMELVQTPRKSGLLLGSSLWALVRRRHLRFAWPSR